MPLMRGRVRLALFGCVVTVAIPARALAPGAPVHARGPGHGAALAHPAQRTGQPPDGKLIYATTCAACHQLTGLGLPEVYPPLAGSEWVTGDEARLIRVVLQGLTGEIEVAGEMISGAMPGWGPSLDDAQVAAVLSYIRSSWGNAAPAVGAGTVAMVRTATASRTSPWTAQELARPIPPDR